MKHQSRANGEGRGLGGLLRSILAGVPWSEREEATETRTFEAPRGGALKIDNANGKTRVIGEDRTDIEVTCRKVARAESPEGARELVEAMRIDAREEAGALVIGFLIPGRWNRKRLRRRRGPRAARAAHRRRSPRTAASASQGLRSAVRCKSSNGTIRIEDVVGDISVATSNAKVKTHCTCGRLRARSCNGKIELEEHRGSVDASTSNGMIHCELGELGSEGVILATSNGRISLDLPEEVDGDVDIRVDNGVIRTEREVGGVDPEDTSGRVKGTLGRGGVPIRLRASNGTISVR